MVVVKECNAFVNGGRSAPEYIRIGGDLRVLIGGCLIWGSRDCERVAGGGTEPGVCLSVGDSGLVS